MILAFLKKLGGNIPSSFLIYFVNLVNFIIRILCHVTSTCSSVGAFETTCCIDIADVGHYEIHSIE